MLDMSYRTFLVKKTCFALLCHYVFCAKWLYKVKEYTLYSTRKGAALSRTYSVHDERFHNSAGRVTRRLTLLFVHVIIGRLNYSVLTVY